MPSVERVDPDREVGAVLIHDADCAFCSAAATALRRLRDVGVVAWEDEAAQRFLAAQFGDPPFALVFVDREESRVYAGRAAASELGGRAGLPVLVSDLVGDSYESMADAVRTVVGVEREPDPYHGAYPLAEPARERWEALAGAAERSSIVVE